MYGHNSTGSSKPAPSIQADMTTRQAAAAAMQIERGRSNPGFSELPSVASSLSSYLKQPKVTATQPQKDPPSANPPQLLSNNSQQRVLQTQALTQPLITPTTTSAPIQPPTSSQQAQSAPVYSRPPVQQRPRLLTPAFNAPLPCRGPECQPLSTLGLTEAMLHSRSSLPPPYNPSYMPHLTSYRICSRGSSSSMNRL